MFVNKTEFFSKCRNKLLYLYLTPKNFKVLADQKVKFPVTPPYILWEKCPKEWGVGWCIQISLLHFKMGENSWLLGKQLCKFCIKTVRVVPLISCCPFSYCIKSTFIFRLEHTLFRWRSFVAWSITRHCFAYIRIINWCGNEVASGKTKLIVD